MNRCTARNILMIFALLAIMCQWADAQQNQTETAVGETPRVEVRVGNLVYGTERKTGVCFSSGYLDLLARETTIQIDREPVDVDATSDALFDFPFVVVSGEGTFALLNDEVSALQRYIEAGGFLLISAGCSNASWDRAFRREFERIFPDRELEELTTEHEIFHTVFDIDHLQTKGEGEQVRLYALSIEGRISLLYSPQGLNDTGNAGGGCCCCGGNEIRNAKYVNANVLAYALQK